MSSRPLPRPHGIVSVVLIVVALVVASIVTVKASDALFTASTDNGANSFSTGTVDLADNDLGTALFTVTGLEPGSTDSACIRVSYTGSLAATVKLYGTGRTATNSLDQYIDILVEEGTNSSGTAGVCGTFTPITTIIATTLSALGTSYATGGGIWTPAGPATRDYKITYELSAAAPNTVMNSNAQVTLVWEARNS